jgi:hypothetical protein
MNPVAAVSYSSMGRSCPENVNMYTSHEIEPKFNAVPRVDFARPQWGNLIAGAFLLAFWVTVVLSSIR